MGRKVTIEERQLIEDLLREGYSPKGAAMLVGRSERIGFYVQAEMKRRQTERAEQPRISRLTQLVRGVFNARKENDGSGSRTPWWSKE